MISDLWRPKKYRHARNYHGVVQPLRAVPCALRIKFNPQEFGEHVQAAEARAEAIRYTREVEGIYDFAGTEQKAAHFCVKFLCLSGTY